MLFKYSRKKCSKGFKLEHQEGYTTGLPRSMPFFFKKGNFRKYILHILYMYYIII